MFTNKHILQNISKRKENEKWTWLKYFTEVDVGERMLKMNSELRIRIPSVGKTEFSVYIKIKTLLNKELEFSYIKNKFEPNNNIKLELTKTLELCMKNINWIIILKNLKKATAHLTTLKYK